MGLAMQGESLRGLDGINLKVWRGVVPSVVEAEIASRGSTSFQVIPARFEQIVITIIPDRKPGLSEVRLAGDEAMFSTVGADLWKRF